MADFTATVTINGEECDYAPDAGMARIPCGNCGTLNEVEIELAADGTPSHSGFSCENCGHWNSPVS
ncbi:hypothetical protein [Nitratidesulfovibrio vulgaris]|uniref:Uncharacterized protein n=1 Tax=Nitratidesulfovibrio vulgaris (strain ATCC 29579 / DSM 644 / CCUG 34227 / NCIMB 8303 / VKM B-1760 / Hildenborough) TaxID=882 RepID=Q729Z9_NITV2|nr:hypothetical protein [Nitratidesulfovibrio vulgaris]AAS96671.1 hypothetical protein DVU_2198 [Nitratidesulfovibrio vulgaris str. Hildenborough]ADP87194.1 hypothetical protein Deval_2049 [Nitratidesulfovibrio vulgaris RCH1]